MRQGWLRIVCFVWLGVFFASHSVCAQRLRSVGDVQIIEDAKLVASGDRVEIFQHGVQIDPEFLRLAENAYSRLESLTGRKLDTATLGPKILIYVSSSVTISHVWMGYDHPREPRGIVFLNPRVYQAALKGTDATYVHEMTHLFTWRFRCHTLREGLADYLALQVHPGAGVGPNPHGYDWSSPIPTDVVVYLGTTRPPPNWLVTDAARRRAYYYASYRFVKFLIEKEGMSVFMKLYESGNPQIEFAQLYGASREELVRMAGM
jgi:hypothetical protein